MASVSIKNQELLALEYLRSILSYCPETGIWKWLKHRRSTEIGNIAGGLMNGYISIEIDNIPYRSARLAWFYMTGEWPLVWVDHINEIKNDDRWENLRLATISENIKFSYENGREPMKGEDNPISKLTEDQVIQIKGFKGSFSQEKIARMFNVNQSQISRIHNNKRWVYLSQ
jgi:hypothetical protein